MRHDAERVARIQDCLRQENLDAVVATLPGDVLLLSGYWPVTGAAIAIATREGQVGVLAPQDEQTLAERSWANPLHLFAPGSLERLMTLTEAVREPLAGLVATLGLSQARVGYRHGPSAEAATYAAMHLYGPALPDLLHETLPQAALVPADALLARLRGVKTPTEISLIRRACRIAEAAYAQGAAHLRPGLWETEAAAYFRAPLSTAGVGFGGAKRADGFVYVMAGPDSAQASGAYARSRDVEMQPNDLALVHCNSFASGHWTDITRTFHFGPPDDRTRGLYEAVAEARRAALDAIAPGVRAADVDRAARAVLESRGLGPNFKHSTGHGVGFAAFDPNSLPRIHPASPDVLETGMVFNVEPAVYFDGWGGLRHCDMVTVTETGVELLTPFLTEMDELVRPNDAAAKGGEQNAA